MKLLLTNTQESKNEPKYTTVDVSIDEENHGSPNYRYQKPDDQHEPENHEWSHQNVVALEMNEI